MRKVRPPETAVVDATARLLRRQNAKAQFREVQFCEKYLDIYAKTNQKRGNYIAVEAKVYAPTRAFKQAAIYSVIANKVYVAEMDTGLASKARALALQTGIGLILVKATRSGKYVARIALPAKPSSIFEKTIAKQTWEQAEQTFR